MPRHPSKTDERIPAIKLLITSGNITSFNEIFNHIPKTVIADQMNWGVTRLEKVMKDPGELTFNECKRLDKVLGLKKGWMSRMVSREKGGHWERL